MRPRHPHLIIGAIFLFLIPLLCLLSPTGLLQAQSVPNEVRQALKERGINVEEALSQAQQLGIDLRNPQRAALRARQLGVPEAKIQEMLQVAEEIRRVQSSTIQATPGKIGATDGIGVYGDPYSLEYWRVDTTGLDLDTLGTPLAKSPYFGYDVFRKPGRRFWPRTLGPVDESYIVGPGDELRLTVWGATDLQYDLQVDPEGRIYISNAGQFTVAGKSLDRLRIDLKRWLSRIYSGLATDPPTVFMDLTLTRLRPIQVFVLGEVANPGGYILGNSSTVFNALYSVGGPLIEGSLRDIRVIRAGKVMGKVDFYNYLLKGFETSPVRLLDNDHIFIPLRGKSVAIYGAVKRPAIYELKTGETLADLLEFAGGLTAAAYTKRIQIERIIPTGEREDPSIGHEVIDLDFAPILSGKRKVAAMDGDTVRVFSVLDVMENAVTIQGAVKQPGQYELGSDIKTLGDLVEKADGFTGDAFLGKADLVRTLEDSTEVLISIDLEGQQEGKPSLSIALMPRDQAFIYSVNDLALDKHVSIQGAVKQPGAYVLRENMTVEDLVFQAGGFTEEAYLEEAQLSRLSYTRQLDNQKALLLNIPLGKRESENGGLAPNETIQVLEPAREVMLQHRDIVYIRTDPNYAFQDTVTVTGEVRFPGQYTLLRDNETIGDVINRTGGVLPTGYPKGGRLIRNGERVIVRIDEALGGKKRAQVILQSGDEIIIPPSPNTVEVRGNVGLEGLIKYFDGKRVSYYIDRAGGLGERPENIFLTQADGATLKLKRFLVYRQNPAVDEGAIITVTQKPEAGEPVPFDLGKTITDTFTIISSALTIIVLAQRLN